MKPFTFKITEHPIDAQALNHALTDNQAGAHVVFCGLVRNHNDGQDVNALEYESHISLAEKEASRIMQEAQDKFDIINAFGMHRIGFLNIGDTAVWIGVLARHRHAAYQANRYLIDEIKHRLPIWKKEHYVSGVSEWVNCQNCCHPHHDHHSLSCHDEQNYYSRQTCLPSIGKDGQTKLKNSKILVIGAGGLGANALIQLASAGVGTIGICEFDHVQIHNLHRQPLYTSNDINKPKADIAKQRLHALNPFITINLHPDRLTVESAKAIIEPYDIIIDATDNFETKFLTNDLSVQLKKPLIQASIYQYEGQLRFYQPNDPQSSCLRCLWPAIPPQACVGTCQEAGVLGAIASFFGNMQAIEAIKYIIELPVLKGNETLIMDITSYQTRIMTQIRDNNCPTCSCQSSIDGTNKQDYQSQSPWEISYDEIIKDQNSWQIIDIRNQTEVDEHPNPFEQAIHIPMDELQDSPSQLNNDTQYVLMCAQGLRSYQLVQTLRNANKNNVFSLQGGINAMKTTKP